MTDRDLLKQALEALVLAQKDAQIAEADYAITALRERLAQPEQEWVGLTEEEAFACRGRDYFETYRAIEAKLKEKNA